jgi:hypothetical protein
MAPETDEFGKETVFDAPPSLFSFPRRGKAGMGAGDSALVAKLRSA